MNYKVNAVDFYARRLQAAAGGIYRIGSEHLL
jgi:hypothetical protein